MSLTADQVIGDRIKLKQSALLHVGYPGSPRTFTWKKGLTTPPIQSWIERPDGTYFVFDLDPTPPNTMPTPVYMKHEGKEQGSRVLGKFNQSKIEQELEDSRSFLDQLFPGFDEQFTPLARILKVAVIVLAALLFLITIFQFLQLFKN